VRRRRRRRRILFSEKDSRRRAAAEKLIRDDDDDETSAIRARAARDGDARPRHRAPSTRTMGYGPAGFANAPVSKFLTYAAAMASYATTTTTTTGSGGWARIADRVARAFAFNATAQNNDLAHRGVLAGVLGGVPCALFLLHHFRVVERQRGSAKLAAFASVVGVASRLFGVCALSDDETRWAPGPFAVVGALLASFLRAVPCARHVGVPGTGGRVRVCGDKALACVVALR
jgi:hypothetical protein